MHRVADLGGMQAGLTVPTGSRLPGGGPHADDALGVVAVTAAVVKSDRAVGEAGDPGGSGRGNLDQLAQPGRGRRNVLARTLEEHELPLLVTRALRLGRRRRRLADGRRSEAVDPQDDAGVAALDLDRADGVGAVELRLEGEPLQHPADRRPLVTPLRAVDRARHDQPLHRTGHRDVVQTQALVVLGPVLGLLDGLVRGGAHARCRARVGDLEPEAAVGETQDVVGARPLAARIRDDDDLELESLGGVNREQPHGVCALFLGDGVALGRADRILLGDEPDEALEIGAAELLVRPGQPRELAQVCVAARTVTPCQHGQVVVVLDEDALAEQLQREPRRAVDEALVALQERADETPVLLGEVGGQRALDPLEDRPALGGGANQDERVVRDADERRGEDGEQRLVVVAVLQQPQVVEQIDDLLLPEVAAAGHPDRRQVESPQLLLEPLRIRPGCEQQDDLAGRRCADVHELAHAARDVPRLGAAPVDARVGIRRLVRDEQLDRRPEHRVAVAGGRGERLEALAELLPEELVDRRQHLRSRAVVQVQRQDVRPCGFSAIAEHRHVGVPEPVDRLELVADEEDLLGHSPVGAEEVDQLRLELVRVLELVHHDRAEPQLLDLPDLLVRLAGAAARGAAGLRSPAPTHDPSPRRTPAQSPSGAPGAAPGHGRQAPRGRAPGRPCARR